MADKSPEEYFNELKPLIDACASEKLTPNNLPPEEAAHEARRVAGLVEKYRDRLINESNIIIGYLDTITARAEAYVYAVSLKEIYEKKGGEEWKQWLDLKKEGYDLRKVLFVKTDYAFRNNETLLKSLENVKKGRGDLDMIKDLLSCHGFYDQHTELFKDAKVNPALFERALEIHQILGKLIVTLDINVEKLEMAEVYSGLAWTYFMKAASEVYKAGRCVFVSEPEIEELFYIDYFQRKKPSVATKEEQPAEQTIKA